MNIKGHINQAWSNLVTAKLRSLLAVLGILVGTGAVVALVTSTQLSTDYELSKFKTLGTNIMEVSIAPASGSPSSKQPPQLKLSDLKDIYSSSAQITSIAPMTQVYSTIHYKDYNASSSFVLGITDAFYSIVKVPIARGRRVGLVDGFQSYCVIGSDLAAKIRRMGDDPIGAHITVGNNILTVVGVAKPRKQDMFMYFNINQAVLTPLPFSHYLSSHVEIQQLVLRLKQHPQVALVKQALKRVMQHKLPGRRLYLRDPQQILDVIGKARKTSAVLLTAIGAISLLVGAIGVMNIMLVSVVERRREIGVRLAIGARRRDILHMFLIESIVLTVFGGLLGVVCGVGVSYFLARAYHWGFTFFVWPPLLGFGVSVVVGVLSGWYPAWRASRLDPIEILQS
jgi:putative ABC transport system permease protein